MDESVFDDLAAQVMDEAQHIAEIMDQIRVTDKDKLVKVCADIRKSIADCGDFPTFGMIHVAAWMLVNMRLMIPEPPVPGSILAVLAAQMEAIERFVTPPDGAAKH